MDLLPKFKYAVAINNPDKKENETSIYRHPEMVNKDFADQVQNLTLQDAYKKRMEKPLD